MTRFTSATQRRAATAAALALLVATSLLPVGAGAQADPTRIVFLAGPKDHGSPGRHEYGKDLRALALGYSFG